MTTNDGIGDDQVIPVPVSTPDLPPREEAERATPRIGQAFKVCDRNRYSVVCDVSRLDVLWHTVDLETLPGHSDGSNAEPLSKASHAVFHAGHDELDWADPQHAAAVARTILDLSVVVRGGTFV